MRSIEDIEALEAAMKEGWPINWTKTFANLKAQIALDMGKWKQQCQIAMEAKSPEVLDALEPE